MSGGDASGGETSGSGSSRSLGSGVTVLDWDNAGPTAAREVKMGTFGGLVWPPPWHGDRNVAMLNRRPEAGGPSHPSYPMARLRTDDPDDAPSTSSAPQAFPTPRPSMTHLRQRVTAFDKRMQREGVYLPRELWERDALRDMGAQGFGVAGDEDGGPTRGNCLSAAWIDRDTIVACYPRGPHKQTLACCTVPIASLGRGEKCHGLRMGNGGRGLDLRSEIREVCLARHADHIGSPGAAVAARTTRDIHFGRAVPDPSPPLRAPEDAAISATPLIVVSPVRATTTPP